MVHLCFVPVIWILVSFDLLQSIGHYIYEHLTPGSILISWQGPVIVCRILQNTWVTGTFWPGINPNRDVDARGPCFPARWIFVCYKRVFHWRCLSCPNPFQWHVPAPEDHLEISLALCICLCCSVNTALHIYYQPCTLETKQRHIDLWGTMTRCPWKTRWYPGIKPCFFKCHSMCVNTTISAQHCSFHQPRAPITHNIALLLTFLHPHQRNIHLISYARSSLKIVFLWCKVRSLVWQAFTGTQYVSSSSSQFPQSFPCPPQLFFCPKITVYAHRMSQPQRSREKEDFCHDLSDW